MKRGATPVLDRQPGFPEISRTNWWTPDWLFNELNSEFGPFTLDAAASADNAKCEQYFTEKDDGRIQPWTGVVWCNPPYADLIKWVRHAYEEVKSGHCERAVLLLPAQTSTDWFHDYALKYARLKWIKRKVKFGGQKDRAIMPTVVVIFDQESVR